MKLLTPFSQRSWSVSECLPSWVGDWEISVFPALFLEAFNDSGIQRKRATLSIQYVTELQALVNLRILPLQGQLLSSFLVGFTLRNFPSLHGLAGLRIL